MRLVTANLAGAGLSLISWSLAAHVALQSNLATLTEIATVAALFGLVLHFGAPYLIPSLLRPEVEGVAAARTLLASALVLEGVVCSVGGAILLVAYPRPFSSAVIAVYGAGMAAGIVAQMLARLAERPWLILGATSVAWLPPILLGLVTGPSGDEARVGILVWAVSAGFVGVTVVAYFRTSKPTSLDREGSEAPVNTLPINRTTTTGKSALGKSVVLIPHLLAFSFITQALRIGAVAQGGGHRITQAYYTTLLLALGMTLLNSVHSVLSMRVQTSSDLDLHARAHRFGMAYGVLALISSLSFLVLCRPISNLLFDGIVTLNLADAALLALVYCFLCGYFISSTLSIRNGNTAIVTINSILVTALSVSSFYLWRPESFHGLIVLFVATMAALCGGMAALSSTLPIRAYLVVAMRPFIAWAAPVPLTVAVVSLI